MGEILQTGLVKQEGKPINAERSQPVVVARHVDEERDQEVNVPISKYNLNYTFQPHDHRDKRFSARYHAIDESTLPPMVDITEGGKYGKVLDQGELGSCVSNSVAYCIHFVRQKNNLSVFDPSRLYIYYFGRVLENFPVNEDAGMYIRSGYKSVANYS